MIVEEMIRELQQYPKGWKVVAGDIFLRELNHISKLDLTHESRSKCQNLSECGPSVVHIG